MTPRERIARLIHPSAFNYDQRYQSRYMNCVDGEMQDEAFEAADRILAAFPEIAGELGYVKAAGVPEIICVGCGKRVAGFTAEHVCIPLTGTGL